jgi:hypothetical protein
MLVSFAERQRDLNLVIRLAAEVPKLWGLTCDRVPMFHETYHGSTGMG